MNESTNLVRELNFILEKLYQDEREYESLLGRLNSIISIIGKEDDIMKNIDLILSKVYHQPEIKTKVTIINYNNSPVAILDYNLIGPTVEITKDNSIFHCQDNCQNKLKKINSKNKKSYNNNLQKDNQIDKQKDRNKDNLNGFCREKLNDSKDERSMSDEDIVMLDRRKVIIDSDKKIRNTSYEDVVFIGSKKRNDSNKNKKTSMDSITGKESKVFIGSNNEDEPKVCTGSICSSTEGDEIVSNEVYKNSLNLLEQDNQYQNQSDSNSSKCKTGGLRGQENKESEIISKILYSYGFSKDLLHNMYNESPSQSEPTNSNIHMITDEKELNTSLDDIFVNDFIVFIKLYKHTYRSFSGFTCLISITGGESSMFIDTVGLRRISNEFFKCKKLKIFCCVRCFYHFQKEFTDVCNYLVLNKELANIYIDWRIRPLPEILIKILKRDKKIYKNIIHKIQKSNEIFIDYQNSRGLINNTMDGQNNAGLINNTIDGQNNTGIINNTIYGDTSNVIFLDQDYIEDYIKEKEKTVNFEEQSKNFIKKYNVNMNMFMIIRDIIELRYFLAQSNNESIEYVMTDKQILIILNKMPKTSQEIKVNLFRLSSIAREYLQDFLLILKRNKKENNKNILKEIKAANNPREDNESINKKDDNIYLAKDQKNTAYTNKQSYEKTYKPRYNNNFAEGVKNTSYTRKQNFMKTDKSKYNENYAEDRKNTSFAEKQRFMNTNKPRYNNNLTEDQKDIAYARKQNYEKTDKPWYNNNLTEGVQDTAYTRKQNFMKTDKSKYNENFAEDPKNTSYTKKQSLMNTDKPRYNNNLAEDQKNTAYTKKQGHEKKNVMTHTKSNNNRGIGKKSATKITDSIEEQKHGEFTDKNIFEKKNNFKHNKSKYTGSDSNSVSKDTGILDEKKNSDCADTVVLIDLDKNKDDDNKNDIKRTTGDVQSKKGLQGINCEGFSNKEYGDQRVSFKFKGNMNDASNKADIFKSTRADDYKFGKQYNQIKKEVNLDSQNIEDEISTKEKETTFNSKENNSLTFKVNTKKKDRIKKQTKKNSLNKNIKNNESIKNEDVARVKNEGVAVVKNEDVNGSIKKEDVNESIKKEDLAVVKKKKMMANKKKVIKLKKSKKKILTPSEGKEVIIPSESKEVIIPSESKEMIIQSKKKGGKRQVKDTKIIAPSEKKEEIKLIENKQNTVIRIKKNTVIKVKEDIMIGKELNTTGIKGKEDTDVKGKQNKVIRSKKNTGAKGKEDTVIGKELNTTGIKGKQDIVVESNEDTIVNKKKSLNYKKKQKK